MNLVRDASRGLCAIAVALLVGVSTAPTAVANLTPMVFTIEATNTAGTGTFNASIDDVHWLSGTSCIWTLTGPVDLRNRDTGAVVATLQSAQATYLSDPAVNLSFAVVSGPSTTLFTIKSALLTFPTPILQPAGRASAAFTVTDGEEDGAQLVGTGGGAYLAQYNGFVPGGTTFANLIPQVNAPAMGSGSLAEEFPGGGNYQNLGTSASNMSSQVSFTLTPNDLASGTSNFELIPEPGALLLVLTGLALVRRRA
jgi:hypothetical protein